MNQKITQELNELIIENQNLIYSVTHYFENYPNKDDLFQVGCMGFIKAYYNYDPSFQVKFTTYAYPYILGEMKKYIREDRGIKVSRDMDFLNLKIDKVSILLSQKLMRQPTYEELSLELDLPVSVIIEARKTRFHVASLDEPVMNDGKEMTLQEVIPKKQDTDIATLLALRDELCKLKEDEQQLIQNRYIEGYTQAETAGKLGMSQVQVSRKEQKVLTKLRDKLAA